MGAYLAADRCLVAELSLLGRFALSDAQFFKRKYPGNLTRSNVAEMKMYDPNVRDRLVVREFRVCREHLVSVRRAPLAPLLKLRLLGAVLRWMIAKRRVFRDELVAIVTHGA
jgi:hypothetical protein